MQAPPPKNPSATPQWSAKDESTLVELRNAKGLLWVSIGAKLSKDPDDCRKRYETLMYERLLKRKKPTPTKVKCLGVLTPTHYFMSEDKTRFRLCPSCKEFAAGVPDTGAVLIDASSATGQEYILGANYDKDTSDETEKEDTVINPQDTFFYRPKTSPAAESTLPTPTSLLTPAEKTRRFISYFAEKPPRNRGKFGK